MRKENLLDRVEFVRKPIAESLKMPNVPDVEFQRKCNDEKLRQVAALPVEEILGTVIEKDLKQAIRLAKETIGESDLKKTRLRLKEIAAHLDTVQQYLFEEDQRQHMRNA